MTTKNGIELRVGQEWTIHGRIPAFNFDVEIVVVKKYPNSPDVVGGYIAKNHQLVIMEQDDFDDAECFRG